MAAQYFCQRLRYCIFVSGPPSSRAAHKNYKNSIDQRQGGGDSPDVPTVDIATQPPADYSPRHSAAPAADDSDAPFLDERHGSGLLDEDE